MQWRVIIEEFRPTMKYIKGPKNIVADTQSSQNDFQYGIA
jgi:hypothetical protein